jgi:hypothetical protein
VLCAFGAWSVFQVLMRTSIEDHWVSYPTTSSQPTQASQARYEPRRYEETEFRDKIQVPGKPRRPWFRVGFMRISQILDSRRKTKLLAIREQESQMVEAANEK